ncbi:MAG: hypothetical protein KDB62_02230 [Solirubrobacterales bacterium]|nr:hypothetical protein [Solirubrobacterales bacterium]
MANEKFSTKAGNVYGAARDNQYVRRVVEDQELRDSLIAAFLAARKAHKRVSESNASAVESVTGDRRVKRELQNAADSLRDASERIREPKKKRHPFRKLFALGLLATGLVLIFSESARQTLLDAVFGAEEEFVYTSTTSPDSAPQSNGTPVGE